MTSWDYLNKEIRTLIEISGGKGSYKLVHWLVERAELEIPASRNVWRRSELGNRIIVSLELEKVREDVGS